jgi:hypothetical protein
MFLSKLTAKSQLSNDQFSIDLNTALEMGSLINLVFSGNVDLNYQVTDTRFTFKISDVNYDISSVSSNALLIFDKDQQDQQINF